MKMSEQSRQTGLEQMESTPISSAQGSPASPTALRDAVRHLVTSVIYGRSYIGCFAKLNPDGSWEKMSQGFYQAKMDGFSEEFCETWPRWGCLSDGACGAPVTWERRTGGIGSSSWPTATALDCAKETMKSTQQAAGSRHSIDLPTAVKAELWASPMANDAKNATLPPSIEDWDCLPGNVLAEMWRTPGAEDSNGRGEYADAEKLKARIDRGGQLSLANQVKHPELWATPNTMDSLPIRSYEAMKRQATIGGRKNRSHPSNLREQIDPLMLQAYEDAKAEANGNWATPNAADKQGSHGGAQGRSLRTDTHGMGGVLNPEWVELLMGLTPGWTSPASLPDGGRNNTTTSLRELFPPEVSQDERQG